MKITICMGSSCFARGNNQNLLFIKEYCKRNDLTLSIELTGELCKNECSKGPVIEIDGREYCNVHPSTVVDLIRGASKVSEV